MWRATTTPTKSNIDSYNVAAEEFEPLLAQLKSVINKVEDLEVKLENFKAPFTPGRIPVWTK
ncbi:MAG: hypothetical protein COB85_08040 [Bacteroidetes bacterium]|nr:MAG: hypothetical protein COB85_08040 [Bacteroidota bacterium]